MQSSLVTKFAIPLHKLAILFYWIHAYILKKALALDPLVNLYLSTTQKKIIKNSKYLKNKHINVKRCFILACGPSINKLDLKRLNNEFCISVSNFFVHPDFKVIKPRYHVFAPGDARMTAEHFAEWFKEYERHASNTEVCVSLSDIDSVTKYHGLTKSNVYYYASLFSSPKEMNFNFDFAKPLPMIQTVAHLAIYLAINIGIKEIYLIGFDHDMILNIGKSRHFYAEQENKLTDIGYEEWVNDIDLEVLGSYYKYMWLVYKQLLDYANDKDIKIINATTGSLLDVFPKIKYEDIYNI